MDELETGTGLNQIGTQQQAGDSRWGSHFHSVCNVIRLVGPACSVLQTIVDEGTSYAQRGDASVAYDALTSFKFVFSLHLIKEIMGIIDILC